MGYEHGPTQVGKLDENSFNAGDARRKLWQTEFAA